MVCENDVKFYPTKVRSILGQSKSALILLISPYEIERQCPMRTAHPRAQTVGPTEAIGNGRYTNFCKAMENAAWVKPVVPLLI